MMMIDLFLPFHRKHPRTGTYVLYQGKVSFSLIGNRLIVLYDLLFLRKERKIYIRTAVCGNGHFEQER